MAAVDPRVESIRLLTSIDGTLKLILRALSSQGTAPSDAAPAVDLDSAHGDPIVKAKDPRDWSGEPQTGHRFSECPAEYLDMLASRFDYFAGKETEDKKIRYCRLDAARARGWAARIRAGYKPPVATDDDGFGSVVTDENGDFVASSEWQ